MLAGVPRGGDAMLKKVIALCLVLITTGLVLITVSITPAVVQADPPAKVVTGPLQPAESAACRPPTATDYKLADDWLALRRRIANGYPDLIHRVESLPAQTRGQALQTAQELNAKLVAVEAGHIIPAPSLDPSLTVGAIGTLWGYRFRVIQRLGNSAARVRILQTPTDEELERGIRAQKGPLPEIEVLLRGFDFSKVADGQTGADGQEVQTRGCFIVRKSETRTTVFGLPQSTIVIEPYDSTLAEMIFEQHAARERWNAIHPESPAERDRKAARTMANVMSRRHANALKYPALLSNARYLISAKLYDPAEKMLRQIVTDVPGSDAAEQAQKELDALPHAR
jgi:hypothetical protein